jgi:hypothetical protein
MRNKTLLRKERPRKMLPRVAIEPSTEIGTCSLPRIVVQSKLQQESTYLAYCLAHGTTGLATAVAGLVGELCSNHSVFKEPTFSIATLSPLIPILPGIRKNLHFLQTSVAVAAWH